MEVVIRQIIPAFSANRLTPTFPSNLVNSSLSLINQGPANPLIVNQKSQEIESLIGRYLK